LNLIAPVRGRIALVDYTCWKKMKDPEAYEMLPDPVLLKEGKK